MNLKTTNYGAARGILGLFEKVSWVVIAFGILLVLGAGAGASQAFAMPFVLAALPGLFICLVGFVCLVLVQMVKANVDTADYTYQVLSVARDQLEVSRQALQKSEQAITYAARQATSTTAAASAQAEPAEANQQASYAARPEPPQATGEAAIPSFMRSDAGTTSANKITNYRGAQIERTIHGYSVRNRTFATLELAKNAVDAKHLQASLEDSLGSAR